MLIKLINDYFGFNKQQRNGVAVLIVISAMLLLLRLAYPFFLEEPTIVVKQLPTISDIEITEKKTFVKAENVTPTLFQFDPNTVSLPNMQRLGFTERTATTLLKFRTRGYKFKKAEDLLKVYGVSNELYQSLAPYIKIANVEHIAEKPLPGKKAPIKQSIQVELNLADSVQLVAINGLGPVFAKRIMKYRELLGGYVYAAQLKEVYGFTEELYLKVAPAFTIDTSLVRKLDLNKADFKAVNRHPYLSFEITKKIFEWRRKTNITKVNLKDILNDEQLYSKLLPYLFFPS